MFFIKQMSDSLIPSFLVSDVSESLRLLTKNERCERIAQVAHQKWATMSDLLRSLNKNERPWANPSGRSRKNERISESLFFWANPSFAHFFAKNEWFAQKTNERIPSPGFIWLDLDLKTAKAPVLITDPLPGWALTKVIFAEKLYAQANTSFKLTFFVVVCHFLLFWQF